MNRLRCFLFATIVAISCATFTLGGIIQTPGKSDPPPPPPVPASATDTTTDGMTVPTSTEAIQIASQNLATAMLMELVLTIF